MLGVGERKERSEGRGTGLPWDEAEGPIPLATKLPKKASPAERRGGGCQALTRPHCSAQCPEFPMSPPLLGADTGRNTQESFLPHPPQTFRLRMDLSPRPDPVLERRASAAPEEQPEGSPPPWKALASEPPSAPQEGTVPQCADES